MSIGILVLNEPHIGIILQNVLLSSVKVISIIFVFLRLYIFIYSGQEVVI